MNYQSLKSIVAFYLHRTDLDQYMDTYQELAAQEIAARCELIVLEKRTTLTFTEATHDLPADFAKMKSVSIEQARGPVPMNGYTRQQLERLFSGENHEPGGYTLDGGKIEISPFGGSGTVSITYYSIPALMTGNADQNAVLARWPDLYVQGMVAQAFQSVQDDSGLQVAQAKFNAAVDSANEHDRFAVMSGSAPQLLEA